MPPNSVCFSLSHTRTHANTQTYTLMPNAHPTVPCLCAPRRRWRRRVAPKAPLGKEGSIKSRLMHKQPINIEELEDSHSDDDLICISPAKK